LRPHPVPELKTCLASALMLCLYRKRLFVRATVAHLTDKRAKKGTRQTW
jgi:hypothetical protein